MGRKNLRGGATNGGTGGGRWGMMSKLGKKFEGLVNEEGIGSADLFAG